MTGPAYIWFDTEFTSLDVNRAELLQVAMLVTDRSLQRLTPPGEELNLYVGINEGAEISAFVEEHLGHVLARCRGEGAVPGHELDQRVDAWLEAQLGPTPEGMDERPVIAGNTVYMDVILARRLLPALPARAHYRLLDVSSLKILWQNTWEGEPFDKDDEAAITRWNPAAELDGDSAVHDAYYDIQASIAELAYYQHHLERVEDLP